MKGDDDGAPGHRHGRDVRARGALTSDGNAVLIDLSVDNPAAEYVVELERERDEAVGDKRRLSSSLRGGPACRGDVDLAGRPPDGNHRGFLSALDDGAAALRGAALDVHLTKDADVLSVVGATVW